MSFECFKKFFIGFFVIIVCLGLLIHYQPPTNKDNEFSNQNASISMISIPNLLYRNNENISSCFSKYEPYCAHVDERQLFISKKENLLNVAEFTPEEFCEKHCKNIDKKNCIKELYAYTEELKCPTVFCNQRGSHMTDEGTNPGKHNITIDHNESYFRKLKYFGHGKVVHAKLIKTSKPNIFGINFEDCEPYKHQDQPGIINKLESAYNNKFGHLSDPVFKILHSSALFVYIEDESAYLIYEKSKKQYDVYEFYLNKWNNKVSESGKNEKSYFKNLYSTEMTATDARIYLHNAYTAALYELFQPFCIGCIDGIIFDHMNGMIVDNNKNVSFMVVEEMRKIQDLTYHIYYFRTSKKNYCDKNVEEYNI